MNRGRGGRLSGLCHWFLNVHYRLSYASMLDLSSYIRTTFTDQTAQQFLLLVLSRYLMVRKQCKLHQIMCLCELRRVRYP